jgi:hypothetical protein
MTFKMSDDRWRELLQIEEETNCDIGAGYAGTHLRQFLADPEEFQEMRRLQAIVLAEFEMLLDELDLGIGKAAAFASGRDLVLDRLAQPSPEIQMHLWVVLQEDKAIVDDTQPRPLRSEVKAVLRKTLTQEDWSTIASAAAESVRVQILNYPNVHGCLVTARDG